MKTDVLKLCREKAKQIIENESLSNIKNKLETN
jgi:hypothetical protein